MLLSKADKSTGKTRGKRKRWRHDYEEKAKAVAYFDSLAKTAEEKGRVIRVSEIRLFGTCRLCWVLMSSFLFLRAYLR